MKRTCHIVPKHFQITNGLEKFSDRYPASNIEKENEIPFSRWIYYVNFIMLIGGEVLYMIDGAWRLKRPANNYIYMSSKAHQYIRSRCADIDRCYLVLIVT